MELSENSVFTKVFPKWLIMNYLQPDEASSSRSLLENYEIHYLECVCAGLFWRNIQKSSTGTFAFQIIYHLTSLLGTHFGVDGACNNLLVMEVINLILTYIKNNISLQL